MCRKACLPARTACASTCGLDALMACHMGVMSRLDAVPKPQRQRRHTVARYARPPPLRRSLSPFSSLYSFLVAGIKGKLTFKEGGRATLPAFGRRLICDGVRGDAPQINRCRGRQLFARWGGEIYPAPPACKIRVGAAVCR